MKKLSLFLFVLMAITSASNLICYENNPQSTWQEIKKFENFLKHKVASSSRTITGTWPEYRSNETRKEDLFNALIYAEKTCDCKNDLTLTRDCQKTLLKPLLVSYIEIALKGAELAPRTYFEVDNQEKYIEYINYLKKQKKHYIDIKDMQAREC